MEVSIWHDFTKDHYFVNIVLTLQLDQFFYNSDFFKNHGYIRTIAYRFRQGGSNSNEIGTNYVKVVLEHQFIANSTLSLEAFNAKFTQMLTDINGKFSKSFSVVPQALIEGKMFLVVIKSLFWYVKSLYFSANHTCSKESMSRLQTVNFVITGDDEYGVAVGDDIQVNCLKEVQKFTKDIWDDGKW